MSTFENLIDLISQIKNCSSLKKGLFKNTGFAIRVQSSQLIPQSNAIAFFVLILETWRELLKTGFYGLGDMPEEFQRAINYNQIGLENN